MGKKNSFEHQCVVLNNRLRDKVGEERKKQLFRKVYKPSVIYRTRYGKKVYYCSECGCSFDYIGQKQCPQCHVKYTIEPQKEYNASSYEAEYFMVLEAKGDIQLSRIYRIERATHYGKPAFKYVWEVERMMYSPKGERKVFARGVQGLSMYYDAFSPCSKIRLIRDEYGSYKARKRYNLTVYDYEIKSLTKQWQYKDIIGLMQDEENDTSILRVIAYPWAETMRKAGHEKLFRYMVYHHAILPKDTSHALNICTRNHYDINDPSIWLENLQLLKCLRMDTHNPKFVCPKDLLGLHRTLLKRKEKLDEKFQQALAHRNLEKKMKRDKAFAKFVNGWQKHMGKILTLSLSADNLTIRPLQNVEEFREEGEAMHHCVFAMKYYDYRTHPSSLILSAKDSEGNRLATIEYDKANESIVQCRAACNAVPKRDKEIRALINDNKEAFDKLLKAA